MDDDICMSFWLKMKKNSCHRTAVLGSKVIHNPLHKLPSYVYTCQNVDFLMLKHEESFIKIRNRI